MKFEKMDFIEECDNCNRKFDKYCTSCYDCEKCCSKIKGEHLINLRVGDAFEFKNQFYIAFSLTPDPAEVYCLNVKTHELEEIYQGEKVKPILNWTITQDMEMDEEPERGKELEVL